MAMPKFARFKRSGSPADLRWPVPKKGRRSLESPSTNGSSSPYPKRSASSAGLLSPVRKKGRGSLESASTNGSSSPYPIATVLADMVEKLGGITVCEKEETTIHHGECKPTAHGHNDTHNLTEELKKVCGPGAVWLQYDYEKPGFQESSKGEIRLVLDEKRYTKPYQSDGTIAFRYDTVLSHISIMHGAFPELRYGLQPGQVLPAKDTDEGVQGGTYFYGSLQSCRQSGQGKWTPFFDGDCAS